MKTITTLFAFLVCCLSYAQENYVSEAKIELEALQEKFTIKQQELETEKELLNEMAESLDTASIGQLEKTILLKSELDELYRQQAAVKDFYKYKGVASATLDGFFPVQEGYSELNSPTENENGRKESSLSFIRGQ